MLNELVNFLRSRKVSEDEVKKIVEEITDAAAGKFYAEAIGGLSEEELNTLDQIEDRERAEAKIRDLVYDKTGKSVDQIMAQYTDAIAEEVYKDARLRYPPAPTS